MNELQRLLGLLEKWQGGFSDYSAVYGAAERELSTFDLAALRTQLQQHAKDLRIEALDGDAGEGISADVLRYTASFLAPEDQ
jgi:hypothetical protein